ncbi:unnamed protein product [Schistosoma turkestanicum]|nr:unnamed protein product [Schistosoma turkestanicum]
MQEKCDNSKMELMNSSNTTLPTVRMSEVIQNGRCIKKISCIFNTTYTIQPHEISGLVLIGIALILALIIIVIKALQTASARNIIIMIITLIMMYIGVGLVTLVRVKLHFQFYLSFVGAGQWQS